MNTQTTTTANTFDLSSFTDIKDALNHWSVTNLIPKSHNTKQYKTLEQLGEYLTKRKAISDAKKQEKQEARIRAINNGGKLIEAKVIIEWKKSKMWGNNPTAEAQIICEDSEGNRVYQNFTSGSVGGCGYDKESTAVANALNQSNAVLKAFFDKVTPDAKEREIFGYGVGIYEGIATLSGGVGTSCYYGNFKSIGYKFEKTASGKTFDVYRISIL
jgi:hypothetical protein